MSKERPLSYDEYIGKMSKEAANTFLELLHKGEAAPFIEIAENSTHAGITLVTLAERAGRPPTEGSPQPTEQELVLLATNFHLNRRFLNVACHVAMNPVLKEKFLQVASPVKTSVEKRNIKNEAELIRALTAAKAKKRFDN